MELRILSPKTDTSLTVDWVEVNTPAGNMVIQSFHAPLIANILSNSTITVCKGKNIQQIPVSVGSIKVAHNVVTLLMHEE
jgi:F0F1-type ATP synthase epsilon subunit